MSRRPDDSLSELSDELKKLESTLRGITPSFFTEIDRQRAAIASSLGGQLKEAVNTNNTKRLQELFDANPTKDFNIIGIPDWKGKPESNVLMYATQLRRDLAPLSLIKFLLKSGKFNLDHKCMKIDPGFVEGDLISFRDIIHLSKTMLADMMPAKEKCQALELIKVGEEALALIAQPQSTHSKPSASF